MDTNKFQKFCADLVDKIDRKHNLSRTGQLTLCQLVEEVGELAKEINKPQLRNQGIKYEELELELADVYLMFNKLASLYNVNIKKAVFKKMEILKERGYLK